MNPISLLLKKKVELSALPKYLIDLKLNLTVASLVSATSDHKQSHDNRTGGTREDFHWHLEDAFLFEAEGTH